MKKIYFAVIAVVMSLTMTAQNVIEPLSSFDAGQKEIKLLNDFAKVNYDTLGWSEFLTITQGVTRFRLTGGGFIFGTNTGNNGIPGNTFGQGFFDSFGGTYGITGALLWVSDINILSANGCNIYVRAHKIDATQTYSGGGVSHTINVPGTIMGESSFHISTVDTTEAGNDGFVVTQFATPLYVWDGSDFALVFDASECSASGDTIGVFASSDGVQDQIFGIDYTWWKYPSANPFWVKYNHVFSNTRMPVIFAIIDRDFVNVNDVNFFQGLQLSVYPNPASDILNVDFAVNSDMNTRIDILDINGKIVYTSNLGLKQTGSHNTSIDISNLSSGAYFVSIAGAKGRLTKKLIVE